MTTIRQTNLIESNVGWIGKIPSHWQIVPAKALFRLRSEKARVTDVHLTPSQKYGVLPQVEYMEITGNRVVLNLTDSGQMKHVEPSDFVSHLRSFQGGLELARMQGKVSGAYTVLSPRDDQYPDYWRYTFKSDTYVQALQTTTDQLRDGQSIRMKEFSLIQLPFVPLDEQKAIADFLDRELAQIDALIDKQELFEIVSQQRINASILSAVTGNGALAFDPSSSEIWTGDVPSDWNVRKLSHLFGSIGSGTTPTSDTAEYYGGTVHWVTTGELRETTILETSRCVTDKAMKDFSALKLHPQGSLVIAMYGATVGRLGFLGMDATVNQACCVMSKPLSVDIEYVYFALQGLREVLVSLATGGGQPNISQGLLKSFMIPVPPHQEQIEIRELLEIEMKQHNALQDTNGRILATLRERRQSLISAAVTGKIDVRKVA